jgi:hypothetical protein
MERAIFRKAVDFQRTRGLGSQESLVYASVIADLERRPADRSCFVTRNPKDFSDEDVEADLARYGCKPLASHYSHSGLAWATYEATPHNKLWRAHRRHQNRPPLTSGKNPLSIPAWLGVYRSGVSPSPKYTSEGLLVSPSALRMPPAWPVLGLNQAMLELMVPKPMPIDSTATAHLTPFPRYRSSLRYGRWRGGFRRG